MEVPRPPWPETLQRADILSGRRAIQTRPACKLDIDWLAPLMTNVAMLALRHEPNIIPVFHTFQTKANLVGILEAQYTKHLQNGRESRLMS